MRQKTLNQGIHNNKQQFIKPPKNPRFKKKETHNKTQTNIYQNHNPTTNSKRKRIDDD
jgi:hypothetical protein